MKKCLIPIFCFLFLGITFYFSGDISDYISRALEKNPRVVLDSPNIYKKEEDFIYVQNTTDFIPLSYSDLLNIYYTVINSGYENFTFYCPSEYKNCTKDVEKISNDPEILSYINNFVHPYNSFSKIHTSISESGEMNITVEYLYTEEEITTLNSKITEIYKEIIKGNMKEEEKIKAIHDYIINHTKYDIATEQAKKEEDKNPNSYKATGPLVYGLATCSGYTDAMALFLERLEIKNFKVATKLIQQNVTGHIWNAVYTNGKWVHLDLTWDDPVENPTTGNGKDYLQHTYFLITTSELEKIDQKGDILVKDHIFSERIYPELKKDV